MANGEDLINTEIARQYWRSPRSFSAARSAYWQMAWRRGVGVSDFFPKLRLQTICCFVGVGLFQGNTAFPVQFTNRALEDDGKFFRIKAGFVRPGPALF